jgi:hypothetical protein
MSESNSVKVCRLSFEQQLNVRTWLQDHRADIEKERPNRDHLASSISKALGFWVTKSAMIPVLDTIQPPINLPTREGHSNMELRGDLETLRAAFEEMQAGLVATVADFNRKTQQLENAIATVIALEDEWKKTSKRLDELTKTVTAIRADLDKILRELGMVKLDAAVTHAAHTVRPRA